jgi:hypothetical protein
MAIGTRLGLGPRDRHIIIKDSLLADGVKQSDDADPTDSEGSIHTTRDGAKEMEALLRSLTHPSSVCACPIRGRTVGGRTNRTSMAAKNPSSPGWIYLSGYSDWFRGLLRKKLEWPQA